MHAQEVFLLDNGTAHISMNRYIVRDGFQLSVNITKSYYDINKTAAIESINSVKCTFLIDLEKFTLNALNTSLLLFPLGDAIVGFFQFNPRC